MAKKLYEEASVQDIAKAIREKNGGTTKYTIGEMGGSNKSSLRRNRDLYI